MEYQSIIKNAKTRISAALLVGILFKFFFRCYFWFALQKLRNFSANLWLPVCYNSGFAGAVFILLY